MSLKLTDSQYNEGCFQTDNNFALYLQAIDQLNHEFQNNQVELVSLNKASRKSENYPEPPVWYNSLETVPFYNGKKHIVKKAKIFTSHYIGSYVTTINGERIEIRLKPRFGEGIFNYLISFAYNIYFPKGGANVNETEERNNYWLLALLWKASLEKAIAKSHIPREYITETKNLKSFKGRLNVQRHIKTNIVNQARFYCEYSKLTPNILLNQVIRYTYWLLSKKGMKSIIRDLSGYEQKLAMLGVTNRTVWPSEIMDIRFSRLNVDYKPVMEISKTIIKNNLSTGQGDSNLNDAFSYFIDVAELWEDYITKLLKTGLKEFNIETPNYGKDSDFLLKETMREIRPDIVVKNKEGTIVAIIDAKYKDYQRIGGTESDHSGISREDLYQMNTYLLHYGQNYPDLIALIVAPCRDENKGDEEVTLQSFSNSNHKIGVVNCDLRQFDEASNIDNRQIKDEEDCFLKKIRSCLKKIK